MEAAFEPNEAVAPQILPHLSRLTAFAIAFGLTCVRLVW